LSPVTPLSPSSGASPNTATWPAHSAPTAENYAGLALRDQPLPQFTLHQAADGAFTFCVRDSSVTETQLRAILLDLSGAEAWLDIEPLTATDKIIQYTRDE
jgi:hypothetical protein